ncbi:hypothetical protein F9802_11365 [Bacillus aerolatus]|uniref:Small, acid-soluble spore protein Tlp n=1 Tax=Bacillus aerolatus TaxID=2653354 RepID=A0A6I1FJS3_9BACI|nr:hypothetical protein [Bacillus aerolatus]KAB7706181.1 hypothetical protein F9802_11365 [Bacillus aerolatus]
MSNQPQHNSGEHQAKIKKMEQMITDTLDNVDKTEDAMKHAESAAQIEALKEENANRLESVEDARREIEEERSFL